MPTRLAWDRARLPVGFFLAVTRPTIWVTPAGLRFLRTSATPRARECVCKSTRRLWLAVGSAYGSGLPAEIGDADPAFLLTQYGQAILNRVNLSRGRVRPNFSIETAAGVEVYRREQRSAVFQIQAANLTDRLNVINFASLFSGTAVAAPRSVSARLRLTF